MVIVFKKEDVAVEENDKISNYKLEAATYKIPMIN